MALTKDRREVEEAECEWTDEGWARECQGVIEVDQLQQSAYDESADQHPAFGTDELVFPVSRPPPLEGEDQQLDGGFGEDERHARQHARGSCECQPDEGEGACLRGRRRKSGGQDWGGGKRDVTRVWLGR